MTPKLDIDKIKEDIDKYSSIKLADMIVSHRYLNISSDVCILSMEELAKRRNNGDTFEFEEYIAEKLATLPKLNFAIPDLVSLLKTLKRK